MTKFTHASCVLASHASSWSPNGIGFPAVGLLEIGGCRLGIKWDMVAEKSWNKKGISRTKVHSMFSGRISQWDLEVSPIGSIWYWWWQQCQSPYTGCRWLQLVADLLVLGFELLFYFIFFLVQRAWLFGVWDSKILGVNLYLWYR